MIRTVFMIGLFAVLGLFALKFVFGILAGVLGILWWLLGVALRIAIIGLLIYFVIRLVSPDTARRIRERWEGGT